MESSAAPGARVRIRDTSNSNASMLDLENVRGRNVSNDDRIRLGSPGVPTINAHASSSTRSLPYATLIKDHASMADEFSTVAAFHGPELIKPR